MAGKPVGRLADDERSRIGVAYDGEARLGEGRFLAPGAQLIGRLSHERAVKGARGVEPPRTHAEPPCPRLGLTYGRHVARNDDLARTVVVGRHEHTIFRTGGAEGTNRLFVGAEKREHGARLRRACARHGIRAHFQERERLLKRQRIRKAKRAYLAERESDGACDVEPARHKGASDADGQGDGRRL